MKLPSGTTTHAVDARIHVAYNRNMPIIKVSEQLSLAEAIRRGQLQQVQRRVEEGEYGQIELSDAEYGKWYSNDGFVSAFEYAILNKRWPIAVSLLHGPDDYLEKREGGPAEKRAMAMLDLLSSLEERRPEKPLPAKLCKQIHASWIALDDALVGAKGPAGEDAQVSFRIKSIFYQPSWMHLAPTMLAAGVPANQYAVDPDGHVTTLLRCAAIRGHLAEVKALLAGGADPLFKMHNGSLAAHAAVDLPRIPPRLVNGAPCIDQIKARHACFELLNAIPGVAQSVDWHGKTPGQTWEQALEWFAGRSLPDTDDPRIAAAYQARKIDLLAATTPSAPAAPRPRM